MFTAVKDGKSRKIPVNLPPVHPGVLYLATIQRCFILQQCLQEIRIRYDEVGKFDERLIQSEVLDMLLRLARRYTGVKIEGITFHWREHTGIRGSQAFPVPANRRVYAWVESDRKIIGQIYATHDLRVFLPN